MTSNQRRRNQQRQLAHLLRNWPEDIGPQAASEVGALDDQDEIQQVINRAIYKAAGWWGWMPNTITLTPAEQAERRDVATYDPRYCKKYDEYKMR